jgi:hypothetical protein
MTALALIARVRVRMDRAHTLDGLHRLALLKYRLITIIHAGTP